jgi:hypothetical protein
MEEQPDVSQAGPFVLTLGAQAPTGAVLFTRSDDIQLQPGTYQLSRDPAQGIQALVVTGSPDRPTGVFRALSGQLTVTRSRGDLMEGHFELQAVGFEAADPGDDGRELMVEGRFTGHRQSGEQ